MKNQPFLGTQWIASTVTGSKRTVPPAPYFRKDFSVKKAIRSAQLKITSLGLYECTINGSRVTDAVFAPGWTDYTKRVNFQSYNITEWVAEGDNAIGVILGDGWYSGHVGWGERQAYGDQPQLIAQVELIYQDGTQECFGTDATWKTSVGPILENDLMMGESYDARLELTGWDQANYEHALWSSVQLASDPGIEFTVTAGPSVRRMEELLVQKSSDLIERIFPAKLYDFGQNICGRARIKIEAPAGSTLTLCFGETLSADGTLYTENLRGARCTDRYTCRGGGVETWEPRFTFHGFRYVEVTGLKDDYSFEIVAVALYSDMNVVGKFACSNPLLNQLQSNILRSQKGNFLEVPMDCPQRDERLGWTGDAQIFLSTAAFNMDVEAFFDKWLLDLRDSQADSGAISCVAPRLGKSNIIAIEDGGPAYSDAIIICPWALYLNYGKQSVLEENYDAMVRYMAFVENHRTLDFIRGHAKVDSWGGYGDWLALDGSGKPEGGTPKDLVGTAFFAHIAGLMGRISRVLGKDPEAEKYEDLFRKIAGAFRHRFVTAEGLTASSTQTSYVLALQFDLLEPEMRPRAAEELAKDITARGFHLATGFVGTSYLLPVLEAVGQIDLAYKLLEQETFPSWLFPVKNGATTIWERWDGWTPEKGMQNKWMNSFNHYAYGAVGSWMYSAVAGLSVDAAQPAYEHIIFKPRPGGTITWAEASLETARGQIAIKWVLNDETLTCDLLIPEGASATFIPPTDFGDEEVRLEAGKHRLCLTRPGTAKSKAAPAEMSERELQLAS